MNPLAQYFVPQWVAVSFLLAFPIPIVLVALLAKKGAPQGKGGRYFAAVLGFYVLYLAYVAGASLSGWFDRVAFPPVVLLYTTFPLAFFLFAFVFYWPVYKSVWQNLRLEHLVQVHIFRLVGGFFVVLAYYDALPKFFALVAGLGDVLTALTSLGVVWAIRKGHPWAKRLTYAWNTFGLIDIMFTAIMANVLTKISIDTGAMGVDSLARFPFCFIPAFAPPTIIFLHVAIYLKLRNAP
jgi:hypothetical protein